MWYRALRWGTPFLARGRIPRLKADVGRGMKLRLPWVPLGHTNLTSVQWPFSISKAVSRVNGGFRFESSSKAARLVAEGDSLSVEFGARLELLEQLRVLALLAACSECVGPQPLGLQSVLGRHARLPPLRHWFRGNGFARFLLLRAGSESRRGVDCSHQP